MIPVSIETVAMDLERPWIRHSFEHDMFVRERPSEDPAQQPGPTVVLIHGLGESALCFEHLMTSPGLFPWSLLAPDLPGYGRSPWRDRPLSLPDHADHLAEWLRARRSALPSGASEALDTPAFIVGHSMGGVIGTLLSERHPDLVNGFVNVDGNLSIEDCVFSGRASDYELHAFIDSGFYRLKEAVYRQGRKHAAQRGYYASLRLCDAYTFHLNSQELVALSATEELAMGMKRLGALAHYIAGVPGGACARSLELLDRAGVQWTAIHDSGHWPFIDQPGRFVDLLVRILDSGQPDLR